MGCNCGGAKGTGTRYQLVKADGSVAGTYLSRTEAIAAMSVQPGSRVVTVT
jgi:hypothetical protein